jgi:hypothetical protein
MTTDIVWLASYPRSGNTYLRTILWQCFGLRSASIYPSDLGGNRALEEYVGHLEHDQNHRIVFPPDAMRLIKTHERANDDHPAIYVVRNGKDACLSLWAFYQKKIPLEAIVRGAHRFGTWADHVKSWHPLDRPSTLLLKYEDMVADLPATLAKLGGFLQREVTRSTLPERETIAKADGRWVRTKDRSDPAFSDKLLAKFDELNGEISKLLGY